MPSLNIVQHNMNRQKIVGEQLRDYCTINDIDFALVQEPPMTKNGSVYGFEHKPFRLIAGGRNREPQL